MNNINAKERGKAAFGRNKTRQPMNDKQFVAVMTDEVINSDEPPKAVKQHYITEWKQGWDDARDEAEADAAKAAKKKTKKKSKRKAKK